MGSPEQYTGLTNTIFTRRRIVLPLVHFNDAYQLSPDPATSGSHSQSHPVGGAARFASALEKVRRRAAETSPPTPEQPAANDEDEVAILDRVANFQMDIMDTSATPSPTTLHRTPKSVRRNGQVGLFPNNLTIEQAARAVTQMDGPESESMHNGGGSNSTDAEAAVETTTLEPLLLFGGGALSPSAVSNVTLGGHMVTVFNELGVNCAVLGTHDFDFGMDSLEQCVEASRFPWLLSNCFDISHEPPRPLGGAQVAHVIDWHGVRVGVIGLVEAEWVSTLGTIDPHFVRVVDYVRAARFFAQRLRLEFEVDVVLALTHMSWTADERLAASVPEIDLVLGGHAKDAAHKLMSEKHVVKSGSDFRHLSVVRLELERTQAHVRTVSGSETSWELPAPRPRSDTVTSDDLMYGAQPRAHSLCADVFGDLAYTDDEVYAYRVMVEHKESDKENEEMPPMAEDSNENQNLSRQNSQQSHHHAHQHQHQHAHDLVIHDHEREESVPPSRHHSRTSPPISLPHSPRYSIFSCTTPRRSRTTSRTQISQQASLTNSYEHPVNGNGNTSANGVVELVVEDEREDGTVSMSVPVQTTTATRGEQEESELSHLLRSIAERRKHESTATASSGTGSRRRTSGVWSAMTGGSEDALDEWLGPSAIERVNVPQRGAERYKLAGVKVECVPVVASIEEDPDMKAIVDYFEGEPERCADDVLAVLDEELDATHASLRTTETNAGNLVADALLAAVHADFAVVHSGLLKADATFPKGPFRQRDLELLLPVPNSVVVVGIKGVQIKRLLEAGVSQWPELVGRFLQVSRIQFAFDGMSPLGMRVLSNSIRVAGAPVEDKKMYRAIVNDFILPRRDIYDILSYLQVLSPLEGMPTIPLAVRNYLYAMSVVRGDTPSCSVHRPSLVPFCERHEIAERAGARRRGVSVKQMLSHSTSANANLMSYMAGESEKRGLSEVVPQSSVPALVSFGKGPTLAAVAVGPEEQTHSAVEKEPSGLGSRNGSTSGRSSALERAASALRVAAANQGSSRHAALSISTPNSSPALPLPSFSCGSISNNAAVGLSNASLSTLYSSAEPVEACLDRELMSERTRSRWRNTAARARVAVERQEREMLTRVLAVPPAVDEQGKRDQSPHARESSGIVIPDLMLMEAMRQSGSAENAKGSLVEPRIVLLKLPVGFA